MHYTLLAEQDVALPTRDGGTVCANVFRPAEAGQFPVIMTMGPYPKDIHFSQWNPTVWKHVPPVTFVEAWRPSSHRSLTF